MRVRGGVVVAALLLLVAAAPHTSPATPLEASSAGLVSSAPFRDLPTPRTTTTTVPPTTTTTRAPTPSRPTTTRVAAKPSRGTPRTPVAAAPATIPEENGGEYVSPIPRNKTEACIVARENRNSYAQGTNRTHKGRYQFARSTWIANGGDPAHWDNWALATPRRQDAVFITTVSRNGYNDWTPYDGC